MPGGPSATSFRSVLYGSIGISLRFVSSFLSSVSLCGIASCPFSTEFSVSSSMISGCSILN